MYVHVWVLPSHLARPFIYLFIIFLSIPILSKVLSFNIIFQERTIFLYLKYHNFHNKKLPSTTMAIKDGIY